MQVNLPPDLEKLVNKRLSSGGYSSVEDVFRRALEAQDFGLSAHKEIFGAIACLLEQGETTFDVWTLASELRRRRTLESAGGEAYLADLDRGIVVEQTVGLRAQRLRELAHRRHLLQASEELQRRAADLTEPLIETKAWLSGVLNELS